MAAILHISSQAGLAQRFRGTDNSFFMPHQLLAEKWQNVPVITFKCYEALYPGPEDGSRRHLCQ